MNLPILATIIACLLAVGCRRQAVFYARVIH